MVLRTDRLRTLRELRGWSQRELGRICGLGETQISKYESGHTDPSLENLKTIADHLDVSADYLLGRSDSPRGTLGDGEVAKEELAMVETYRREGWLGVIRLGAEQLAAK